MTHAERFAALTAKSDPKKDLRGKSIRAALSSGSVSAVDFALRIGSTAVLARLVLPEHYGLIMMVTAFTALFDQFKDLGISSAALQRPTLSHYEASNLFWINLGLGTITCLLICGAAPAISAYYSEPRLVWIAVTLASTTLLSSAMVQHQIQLARQLRQGHTAIVRLSASLLSTGLAVFLAWKGAGYWALVWRDVARAALLTMGMWLCFPWIPSLPSRKTSVRQIVYSGLHFSGAGLIGSIAAGADRYLIGPTLGPEPIAILRQAYGLLLAPIDQLISPLFQVSTPSLSLIQSEEARFERYYRKILTLICVATMPTSVFFAIYAEELTALLLGPKWTACAPIVAVLCCSVFIKQPVGSATMILFTRQKSKRYMQLSMVENIGWILALLVGVKWGIMGIAWADVIFTYGVIGPKLWFALRGSPVSRSAFFQTIARPAGVSLGMGVFLLLSHHLLPAMPVIVDLMVGTVIGGCAFISVWLITPGGKEELRALIGDLRAALLRKPAASSN